MLKFMDGFDQLRGQMDIPGGLEKCGYTISGSPQMVEGRTSTQQSVSLSGPATIARTFVSRAGVVVVGFAFRAMGQRGSIVSIDGVGTVTWDPTTGKLSCAGGVGTAIVLLDLWYYIEVRLDKNTSTVEVYVNNSLDISAPAPASASAVSSYVVTWSSGGADQFLLDDLQFVDSSEGRYTDRVGPIQISSRLPVVDVDKEWSPSTGTDHYPLVYNQPPVDGKYVQSNTSGATDTFLSNTPIPNSANILAVGITALCRKSDVDNRQLGMVIGQKGQAQKEVVDTALSTDEKYSYAVFETNQTGQDWTDERLSEAPFGVVVRP